MPEIMIYDEIGPDWLGLVSATRVSAELAALAGQDVTMRINSPGGDVAEGLAIYNAMLRHARVTVEIDGLAASAASFVAMAGRQIRIAENAIVMIHDAMAFVRGYQNPRQTRELLQALDTHTATIAGIYAKRAGDKATVEQIREWMDANTYMDSAAALERGFADVIGQAMATPPVVEPGTPGFDNLPERFFLGKQETQRRMANRIAAEMRLRVLRKSGRR